ncbi:MAG: ABC transporter ATP-binding protein [Phycisphaerales bacterium]
MSAPAQSIAATRPPPAIGRAQPRAPPRPADAPARAAAPAPLPSAPADPADVLIRADNLGKCYRIYRRPLDRALEWVFRGQRHKPFWAVRGVSFEVRRGECLGIIGANGSGKSTLLKMLTGALWPTEGAAECCGRVLSLIELGTGLNPQLTGRANIVNTAALLNFPPGYARETMAEIEAFAELDEFFDRPVMLYSSGMRVRLAFSMFACFRPDIFLIDEALSVGDVFFQQKCAARLRGMLDGGLTMVFVSHDQAAVLNLCDRAILLSRGKVLFQGAPEEAISRYSSSLAPAPGGRWAKGPRAKPPDAPAGTAPGRGASGAPGPAPLAPEAASAPTAPTAPRAARPGAAELVIRRDITRARREHRHGNGRIRIVAARVTSAAGRDAMSAAMGETLSFHVLLEGHAHVERPRASVRFFDRLGNLVFGAGTFQQGAPLPPIAPGERRLVRFDITMDLRPDTYTFGLGCGEPRGDHPEAGVPCDRLDLLGPIIISAPPPGTIRPFHGIARLPMRISHDDAPPLAPLPPLPEAPSA